MVDKRGKWSVGDAIDLEKVSDMIPDKMARNLAEDIKRQLGPKGLTKHKPVITGPGAGPGGVPKSSVRKNSSGPAAGSAAGMKAPSPVRSSGKDGDLMSTMLNRLQQVEALNLAYKKELAEKQELIDQLKDRNKHLTVASSADSFEQIAKITADRDKYKQQVVEMTKFLSDYGLKWVGGEGGMREGAFDAKSIKEELKF